MSKYFESINSYALKRYDDVFGKEVIASDTIYDASSDQDFEAAFEICDEFDEAEILNETRHADQIAEAGEFNPAGMDKNDSAYIPDVIYCVLTDIQDAIDAILDARRHHETNTERAY